jgi:hypothetical protein
MRIYIVHNNFNEETYDLCCCCGREFEKYGTRLGGFKPHDENFPERRRKVQDALERVGDGNITAIYTQDVPTEYFELYADQPEDMDGYECDGCGVDLNK